MAASRPVLLISSDCHGGVPVEHYKDYLEERYLDDFAEYLAAKQFNRINKDSKDLLSRHPIFFYPDAVAEEFREQLDERQAFSVADPAAERLAMLETEGYVAEVIFPDAAADNEIPFSGLFGGFGGFGGLDARTTELALAGQRAYNRRLAEFVDPARQAGCAVVSYADIDAAVATVQRAAESGLRGVMLDGADPSFPQQSEPIFAPRYDPLWAALADTGVVAHFHIGSSAPTTMYSPDVPTEIANIEIPFWGHRALWWLIWGGVLERHPGLRCVFTEQGTSWIAQALRYMDWQWTGMSQSRHERRDALLPLRPSDYWKRQCFSGASLMSIADLEARAVLDTSTIMYGTDSPHPEGTWGRTHEYLGVAFSTTGCTEAEVRMVCGENALRCYGFDPDVLGPIADRVGPPVERLLSAGEEQLDDPLKYVVARPDFGVA
ncbi:MAG: amidohydrolase family protein [Acidimicrobiia bacterium]